MEYKYMYNLFEIKEKIKLCISSNEKILNWCTKVIQDNLYINMGEQVNSENLIKFDIDVLPRYMFVTIQISSYKNSQSIKQIDEISESICEIMKCNINDTGSYTNIHKCFNNISIGREITFKIYPVKCQV